MHTTLKGTFFTVSTGIKYGEMKNLKALGIMLNLGEWIIRTVLYATDVSFMQKLINSSPVRCEVRSI